MKQIFHVLHTTHREEFSALESMPRVLLLPEVATACRVAPVTICRWLAEARKGLRYFPLTISQPGQKLLWLASDIEVFLKSQSNVPPPVNATCPAKRMKQATRDFKIRQEQAAKTLAKHRAGMK